MIDKQFSESVAWAQQAKKLNGFHTTILTWLGQHSLPAPLANTGLQLSVHSGKVFAHAHGKDVEAKFDHVWLQDSSQQPRLGGRIQFWLKDADLKDQLVLYRVIFDHLGNASLGTESKPYFGVSIASENERSEVTRQIALGLINAIHKNLDTISIN